MTPPPFPTLGIFDGGNRLCFNSGPALEAVMETGDAALASEGYRTAVLGARPVGDVSGAHVSVATAETFGGARTYGAESAQNVTGLCPLRASGRVARFRMRVPAAATWRNAIGLEPVLKEAGKR